MRCCPNCFNDSLAADAVRALSRGAVGDCDFCKRKNVEVCELTAESEIASLFDSLFDVFVATDEIAADRSMGSFSSLIEAFQGVWDVFSFKSKRLQLHFLQQLFSEEGWFASLCDAQSISVAPRKGSAPIEKFAIFGDSNWSSFSHSIKHEKRYSSRIQNEDILLDLLKSASAEWDKGRPLYRARLWNSSESPNESDLYEPPFNKAASGRMCPAGVPCLYVADSPETAAAEVRAGMHDGIAIAHLALRDTLKYIDLRSLNHISPFSDVDASRIIANRDVLQEILHELTKPIRPDDSALDYIPVQYLSELIRSEGGYRAIGYSSIMHPGGLNIACFEHLPSLFEIKSLYRLSVSNLEYKFRPAP